MRLGRGALLWGLLLALPAACGDSAATGGAPPLQAGPATRRDAPLTAPDPGGFDWERAQAPAASTHYVTPDLRSGRTLAQTTAWLQWALEQYGHLALPTGEGVSTIASVRFAGSEMVLHRLWYQEGGTQVTDSVSRVDLREIDTTYGALRALPTAVHLSVRGRIAVVTRYWTRDGGRFVQRGDERTEQTQTLAIPLERRDGIAVRVAWALMHAARLSRGP